MNYLDELQDSNAFMEALGSLQTPVNRTVHHHKPTSNKRNSNLNASGVNKAIPKLAQASNLTKLTVETTNETNEGNKTTTLSPIPSNISPVLSHSSISEKTTTGHQLNNTNNNLININNIYNRVIQMAKPIFLLILFKLNSFTFYR
jgi:hypothetical protein